ncbi:DNA topoisomerase [Sulfurimonas sp.]|uniref:DNA topoisomerase n=1 Tax=Sulfurimonas sp. TaxID=2022749 RepID=UPI0025F4DF8F|nr:DNA topoisomerase [Sulfurimonas sp.]
MKNLIIVDELDKRTLVIDSVFGTDSDILLLSDIVYDFNILNDIEMEELFFYFDESIKNKELIQEISRILQVRQYYVLNANSEDSFDNKITNANQILYGNIKADALRKNIDLMYQNKISQMVRWMLFKHRSADANSIRRLLFNRASPVIMGIIANAEQKITDFKKEDYIRVSVEYIHKEYLCKQGGEQVEENSIKGSNNLSGEQVKIHNIKLHCKTKFKKEHQDELDITLKTLNDINIPHIIKDLKPKTEEMRPFAPLTTVRLQRNCFYLFRIDPIKTMSICEELCNGISIDGIKTKLITSPFTEGHQINDEAILEINKALIKLYGINYVLPSRRTFGEADELEHSEQEAVRPLYFSDKFSPSRLKSKLPSLHFEIYKFIYDRTLATQMKNSIYDASKLVVEVNGMELVAHAHKLEFDGWEKLDGYRQRVSEEDDGLRNEEIVFPKNLYLGKELKPVTISDYDKKEKNPPRYGKGRLLSILVEQKLCKPESAHIVIDSMEKAGLIIERQQMMHPQEIGMISNALFKEYAPALIEEELLRTFEKNVTMVGEEELEPEEIESEYELLGNDFEIAIGFEGKDDEPEDWMIEKAKKVALFHGDILTDNNPIFFNRQMILNYLNAKENELEKIGKCPECKKQQVVEDSLSFRCIDKECKFIIYKSGKDGKPGGISGFFNHFQKPVPIERYRDILEILLKSNGKLYFEDLVKKNKETFNAYVVLKKDTTYKTWQLSPSYPRSNTAKINDKLKAKTLLGEYTERITNTTDNKLLHKESVSKDISISGVNNIELLPAVEYDIHIEKFQKKEILTTTLSISVIKKSKDVSILSLCTLIDNSLNENKTRFKIYENGTEALRVLLVGEYLITDLIDLGLSTLTFNNKIGLQIS